MSVLPDIIRDTRRVERVHFRRLLRKAIKTLEANERAGFKPQWREQLNEIMKQITPYSRKSRKGE